MKKLIIKIHKDKEEAKKILSRFQMAVFNKANNRFYGYIRNRMKHYIIKEDEQSFDCCNEVEDDKADHEIKKLETFFFGDYKQCDIIMKENSRVSRFMFTKFLKLMKNKTVIGYFNLFGVIITWRVEE